MIPAAPARTHSHQPLASGHRDCACEDQPLFPINMCQCLIGIAFAFGVVLTSAPALADRVAAHDLEIDRTEVTVGAFAAFVDRTGFVTRAEREGGSFEWGAGWERRSGWTFRAPKGATAAPDEPAVHINWTEADAFCRDAGGRLPTRAEWTAAAYTENRAMLFNGFETGRTYEYPVGDAPDGMNTNRTGHVPVGTTKRGVNGLYDMGANVLEWLADRHGEDALTAGGSWWYGPGKTRAGGMQWKPADFFAVYIGFRCGYESAIGLRAVPSRSKEGHDAQP